MPKLETYMFEYDCEGVTYSLEVPAYSRQEAESRVAKMSMSRYLGILGAKIPAAVPGAGWLARLYCWWKNLASV